MSNKNGQLSGIHFAGYVETFKYTTHPWLVKLYLDCPENLTLSGVTLQVGRTSTKSLNYDEYVFSSDRYG